MKQSIFITIMLLASSCCIKKDLFYLQHTKVTEAELPKDCQEELIRQINTSWLKYGKSDCYYFNTFSQSIAFDNKDCFLGMDLALVRRLLGQPTKEIQGAFTYELDFECTRQPRFKSLVLYHSNGLISDIHFGTNRGKDQ